MKLSNAITCLSNLFSEKVLHVLRQPGFQDLFRNPGGAPGQILAQGFRHPDPVHVQESIPQQGVSAVLLQRISATSQ